MEHHVQCECMPAEHEALVVECIQEHAFTPGGSPGTAARLIQAFRIVVERKGVVKDNYIASQGQYTTILKRAHGAPLVYAEKPNNWDESNIPHTPPPANLVLPPMMGMPPYQVQLQSPKLLQLLASARVCRSNKPACQFSVGNRSATATRTCCL